MALTACTSDESLVDVQEQEQDYGKIVVTMPQPEKSGVIESRSMLYYDKFAGNNMLFGWEQSDKLGVFPYNVEDITHLQQIRFYQDEDSGSDPLHRTFLIYAENQENVTLEPGETYVAYFPYSSQQNSYTMPVSYRNQKQIGIVDMRHYFETGINEADRAAYVASEKEASKHLGEYDYLCSAPTKSQIFGGINLQMKRVGSIVRFYIKYPAADKVYTELQLFNSGADFVLDGTIDIKKIFNPNVAEQERKINETNTNHVVTLQLGDNGFDIGTQNADNPFYNINNKNAYLIAYMMLAPIDLSASSIPQSVLYLIAHDQGNPENKHYYKATLSAKPNLKPNIFHQWSINNGSDNEQPIEFVETTIEDWRQATGVDNGTGTGTSGW